MIYTHWPGIPAWSHVSGFLNSFLSTRSRLHLFWQVWKNERWAAQALNASKPPLAINNSGPCTPQQLGQSCRETASRVEFGCFNCNHEATRVLSRLGLSTWRRWLLLSLVVSMVPFGYQVQVRLLSIFVGAPAPCRPKPLKQCPAVLQRFKVYEWLVFKKLKICSSKPW